MICFAFNNRFLHMYSARCDVTEYTTFGIQLLTLTDFNDSYIFTRERVLAIAILSLRLSVCLSHGWIRQKRCKLKSLNFYRRLSGRL